MLRRQVRSAMALLAFFGAGCGGSEFSSSRTGTGAQGTRDSGMDGRSSAGGLSMAGGEGAGGAGSGGSGMDGVGGVTGTGAKKATGGVTSTGGMASKGGMTGTGSVTNSGGVANSGGVTGTSGVMGAGGVTSGGGLTGTGGSTNAGGIMGSGGGCPNPTIWYPDSDQDGYGRSTGTVSACQAPPNGKWAKVGGDCADDNSSVHPNATTYFDVSYKTSGGIDSFDYDCSGAEEGDPTQGGAAPACTGLLGLYCTGSGWVPTSRTGANMNRLCGSHTKAVCQTSGLSCAAILTDVSPGYTCR